MMLTIIADAGDVTLEQGARDVAARLANAGYIAYWAGGCVRDRLLGRHPKDYDIVTSARPDQIEALFPKTVAVGKAFGVVGVCHAGHWYEVATFRRETGYSDGRRPDTVAFADPEADAGRRDFTVNALFYDPFTDRVIDYVAGQRDLAARRIRAVGCPAERYREDHLRMLRAIRFAVTLDFELERETLAAIAPLAHRLERISAERIRDELVRLAVDGAQPGKGLQYLYDTGLLAVILPEVAAMVGVEQPPQFHPEGDVFTHTRLMWDLLPQPRSAELAMAVLLHDVGKPVTARPGPGRDGEWRIRFDGHDQAGARLAKTILHRLRFSNVFTETVVLAVHNHMRFMHVQEMRRAKLRAMVAAPTFELELELHRLDCLASHGDLGHYHFLRRFQQELATEPRLPAPLVNGHDVMGLGVPRGPSVGQWLQWAYDEQLEHEVKDRENLLQRLAERVAAD